MSGSRHDGRIRLRNADCGLRTRTRYLTRDPQSAIGLTMRYSLYTLIALSMLACGACRQPAVSLGADRGDVDGSARRRRDRARDATDPREHSRPSAAHRLLDGTGGEVHGDAGGHA